MKRSPPKENPESSKRTCKDEDKPIAVLTMKKDRNGVWMEELTKRLKLKAKVEIVDIDTFSFDPAEVLPWSKVVNRVTDAAPSHFAKATIAILDLARLQGLPVINGSACYSMGMNKAVHHALLTKVGLKTPRTVVCRELETLADACLSAGLRFPILVKPNAGGRGQGIIRFDDIAALRSAVGGGRVEMGSDGMMLVSEYIRPAGGAIYRVWTLGSHVQCAVRAASGLDEVLLGGVCMCNVPEQSVESQTSVQPWKPSAEVVRAVEQVMQTCGADCGSVELLWPEDQGAFGSDPYYFDVNMLSTLPVDQQLRLPGTPDPFDQLAEYVLK